MTTKTENVIVGAVVYQKVDWTQINWCKVNTEVSRLQRRIAEAQKQGRYAKIKSLQYLLTHSFSAKALAVRKVTENTGKRTPGIDGQTWDNSLKKSTAVESLKRRGYQPKSLKRVYIKKSNGKLRPLGIPTMKDRAMQALHAFALEPIAETTADLNSFGFRKKRSTADAIAQSFIVLAQTKSPQWILEADIQSCFDKISHEWLLANIPMDKTILRKWLKAGYVDKHLWHATEEGTPQGSLISPVLANLTLDKLQQQLKDRFPNPKSNHYLKINLVRYCDDFIITGETKELLEQKVKPYLQSFLSERGLKLSEEKTKITHINEGFNFLGFNLRKYNGKLLTKPSKKNVLNILTKIRNLIKCNKQATPGKLINLLNPILRGWCNYYRHVVSKRTFARLRSETFRMIWRWCKRRHPMKSIKWIKCSYFKSVEKSNWEFFGDIMSRGKIKETILFNPQKVQIKRHVKVKAEANVYDPKWKNYFEQRDGYFMKYQLKEKQHLLFLWNKQKGVCPICKQGITIESKWQNHHVIHKAQGGNDTSENRMLLHETCHQQVHSKGRMK